MSGLYVYALVGGPATPATLGTPEAPETLGTPAILGTPGTPEAPETRETPQNTAMPEIGSFLDEPVRLLDWSGVWGAVSEMAAPPRLSREALEAHDAVVRRLAARFAAILPARFGQWAPDEAELAAGIAARRAELVAALTLVEGCVQMTLRLFSREAEAPPRGAAAGAGGATGLGGGGSVGSAADLGGAAGPGSRYLAARRRQLEMELPPAVRRLRRALAPLLKAERLESGAPPLLATAHDLVAKEQAERYRELVAEQGAAPEWRARVSGPWPPYAFAPGLTR